MRIALLLLFLLPGLATAQRPAVRAWLEPRLAFPIGEFADGETGIEARTSPGFGAGAAVRLGAVELFGEYERIFFRCGECGRVGLDDRVLDHGWGGGVMIPFRNAPALHPWLRLGVTGQQLRFSEGNQLAYSDPALGWQVGLGATARPLPWLTLQPSLLYRRHRARFGFGIDVPDRSTPVSYLTLGVAVGLGL